ncbi:hypothetical protein DPMN_127539 [Dreissena polymorpha]|uniref:Uncharacterized protein n=1 Tax=Dreissena polymorpha TaxID=45954 RepID=A0A9D4H1F0_DREPO|nr:hypothetical protein DPMN_127539 [Dreissena polymorpha]
MSRAYKLLTRKNAPPHGGYVFQPTSIIFELVQDIIGMNLLTEFHEDRTINVASRVLTRFYYSHIRKNALSLGSHTNLLTKFHEDWTINVASRVLTRKNAPPPGGHFHEDWTINVASRLKNAPPLSSHVFQAKVTIFELIQDIIGANLLSKFHEDRKINVASRVLTRKNAPPPGGHCHEDQTINVASRVKNAPPLGSHVFQANVTIFELIQDIIKTNLPTKFHKDWTINVPSRELTRQMLTPHNSQRTKGDHKSSP